MLLKEPMKTNSFGIRYLNRLGRYKNYFCVRIEIGCKDGKHGRTIFFYQGKDFSIATKIANKVNELICIGGHELAVQWKEKEMMEWLKHEKD